MAALVLAKQPVHVANQAALYALSPAQVLSGDIAIRDDNDTAYLLIGADPAVGENWHPITGGSNVEGIAAEASARTAGDASTLITATGRAAALALVFGA